MRYVGITLLVGVAVGLTAAVPESNVVGESAPPQSQAKVQIKDVDVRLSDHGPVVLLKAENKAIPIFVDPTVAGSIQAAQTGQRLRRPLSHDLMHTILKAFGGKVTQVIITLKDGIYYADLTVEMKDASKVFDSRSSDAIALAIHFKAPILVSRELLDSAGKMMRPESEAQTL